MEGLISKTTRDRLPAVIRDLSEEKQKMFIYLRLRKSVQEISERMDLPTEEVKEKINSIKRELIRAGQLYLVEDPKFVPVYTDEDDSREIPLPARQLDIDEKLVIKEFIGLLRETIAELPDYQARILRLRYGHNLSAKDIAAFAIMIDLPLLPGKPVGEVKEQEIYYALNKALMGVFKGLKIRYRDETSFDLDNLKYIFEEIEL